jgi:hypothetical protein
VHIAAALSADLVVTLTPKAAWPAGDQRHRKLAVLPRGGPSTEQIGAMLVIQFAALRVAYQHLTNAKAGPQAREILLSTRAKAPPVGLEPTTDRLEGCCSIL